MPKEPTWIKHVLFLWRPRTNSYSITHLFWCLIGHYRRYSTEITVHLLLRQRANCYQSINCLYFHLFISLQMNCRHQHLFTTLFFCSHVFVFWLNLSSFFGFCWFKRTLWSNDRSDNLSLLLLFTCYLNKIIDKIDYVIFWVWIFQLFDVKSDWNLFVYFRDFQRPMV